MWFSLALKTDVAFTNDATKLFEKVDAGAEFKNKYPVTVFDERTLLCMQVNHNILTWKR